MGCERFFKSSCHNLFRYCYVFGVKPLRNALSQMMMNYHHEGTIYALRWRHNGHDSVSNHQPHHCLVNRLFRRRSKKTSKLRVTGLCVGNSPGTGEFPAQMASNAENVFIWWRHHGSIEFCSKSHCFHQNAVKIIAVLFLILSNERGFTNARTQLTERNWNGFLTNYLFN